MVQDSICPNQPWPYTCSKNKTKVELNFSNYATKSDLKKVTDADKSNFAKKSNLASLKLGIDKLDIGKLETTLTTLSVR